MRFSRHLRIFLGVPWPFPAFRRSHNHQLEAGPNKTIETAMTHPSQACIILSCEEVLLSAMLVSGGRLTNFLDLFNIMKSTFLPVVPQSIKARTEKRNGEKTNKIISNSLDVFICRAIFKVGNRTK